MIIIAVDRADVLKSAREERRKIVSCADSGCGTCLPCAVLLHVGGRGNAEGVMAE